MLAGKGRYGARMNEVGVLKNVVHQRKLNPQPFELRSALK